MTLEMLIRGQAYHFTFREGEMDAILIDVDYTSAKKAEKLNVFPIGAEGQAPAEAQIIPAEDYVEAVPAQVENSPGIEAEIAAVIAEMDGLVQHAARTIEYEDDAVDGIEQREDPSCALFYLLLFETGDLDRALFHTVNSMPYLLKRKPRNRLAYQVLLHGVWKAALAIASDTVKKPVFPDQSDLYAEVNVTMLRKYAYQILFYYNNSGLFCRIEGAKRFVGFIHSYQSFNSRGLVLFANEHNLIPFSISNIMDDRLVSLLKSGLNETGRIEVEFSLAYIPKEGGAQVSSFVCTRMCLTDTAVECCRALGKEVAETYAPYSGYRDNPICPTAYYPADSYLGISRIFHETQGDGEGTGKGLFNPIGTQTGRIMQWPTVPRKNNNGVEVWEGELSCNGNIIHFNLFQVYDRKLHQLLTLTPEQAVGATVKFEPAYNAGKNRIAVWADVVRSADCDLEIPPEYDPDIPWSVARSQQAWTAPQGVADSYKALQPWLPAYYSLLENCHIGKLDLQHLSSSQYFLGGRIVASTVPKVLWYHFQIASIHERYLMNILMSALCYKVYGNLANDPVEINVMFSLQPSSIPGRDMADNIILLPLSRATIWNLCDRQFVCPFNRFGNILFEMTDQYLPLPLKGKPIQFQKKFVQDFGNPDIFRADAEYSGQITKMSPVGVGTIVDSTTGAEILFRNEQIYEEGLQEKIRKVFATNRYAGMLVRFQKKQAQQDKTVSAIRADRIYSRETEQSALVVSPDYRGLCETEPQPVQTALPEAPKAPAEVYRQGVLVGYQGRGSSIICTLCDEHPLLWQRENNEKAACTHLKFSVERISDGRLRQAIETGSLREQIPVLFQLAKASPQAPAGAFPFQPDQVHISDETAQKYGLTESREISFAPLGPAVKPDAYEEAKRFTGKVVTNEGVTRIWVEIDETQEKPCFQLGGVPRTIVSFNTRCTSSAERQYVLDKTLRQQLQSRMIGMEVSFIPIRPVDANYSRPQAGYLMFTPAEKARQGIFRYDLFESFTPQICMPIESTEPAGALRPLPHSPAMESGMQENPGNAPAEPAAAAPGIPADQAAPATPAVMLLPKPAELNLLQYSTAENEFDRLIRGEIAHIDGNFADAARKFQEGDKVQGNIVMQQKGAMLDGHLEGLSRVPSREKRIAYADALVRNGEMIFKTPASLVNTIIEMYCTRADVINWERDFDQNACNVMQKLQKMLPRYGINQQSTARVSKILAQMEIARQGGRGEAQGEVRHPENQSAVRVSVPQPVPQTTARPVPQPAARPAPQPAPEAPLILQRVPFLNHMLKQSPAGRNQEPMTQRKVLEEIMKKAESFLRMEAGRTHINPNRLYAASYYFSLILRERWTGRLDEEYEFARKALSFAVLPSEKYQETRRAVRENTGLWELARMMALPDDIRLLPKTDSMEASIRYLHFILQTACVSGQEAAFFTEGEIQTLLAAEKSRMDNKWAQALRVLCIKTDIPLPDSTTDIHAILQVYRANLDIFEKGLPRIAGQTSSTRDYIAQFRGLGNRYQEDTPIFRCSQAARRFGWFRDSRLSHAEILRGRAENMLDAFLYALEKLSIGASNDRASLQINCFDDVLGLLKKLKGWIIQEPNLLTAEYILPCVESYITCLEDVLRQMCVSNHHLKLEALMGSINEAERVFTIPVSISCDPGSCSCSSIRISAVRNGANTLTALSHNTRIPPLESGDTSVVEMRFQINENLRAFRERQSISVGLRLDYEINKYVGGSLLRSQPDHVEKLLDCPIQQAQYEIDPNAFNSKATQYDDRYYFIGRKKQIEEMQDALYDPSGRLFRHGVGIIIFGQRRSGKSWLAGKLCSDLKKLPAVQTPIICDKIDLLQLEPSTDIMTEIINKIVVAMPKEDRDLAEAALEYAKPYSMLDTLTKTLQLHRMKNAELDFDELQSHLEAVRNGFRKLNAADHASFPAFYYELERRYMERHSMNLPAMTIVLDEFTSIYDRVMSGSMTLQEVLSVVKLIESYRVNVILICADHYKSVLAAIDENAFTHYKTEIEVTGLEQPETVRMICRPLAAARIDGAEDNQGAVEPRVDEEGAYYLHQLYFGNVYLLAKACEAVINHMNYHGYLHINGRQLNNFEEELLVATMTRESMEAYVVDGRFLERKIASFVLTRLNTIAMSRVAQAGTQGIALYSDVLSAVKEEYEKLFMQADMRHFIDLLNANAIPEGALTDRELVMEKEFAMEKISAVNVLNWLVERKVLYRGSSTSGEVTLCLKLQAYIKAREIPHCECRRMEELATHSQAIAEIPASMAMTEENNDKWAAMDDEDE